MKKQLGNTTFKSYRHYKGGSYTLLLVARSSEARDELFAVYVSHQTQQIWVRPWEMFNELVTWRDGVRRPRFTEWTDDDPATQEGYVGFIEPGMAKSLSSPCCDHEAKLLRERKKSRLALWIATLALAVQLANIIRTL